MFKPLKEIQYRKNLPLIIAPCSKGRAGGIGTWAKNMIAYSEFDNRNSNYIIYTYSNHLRKITNTQNFTRIISGLILYSKLFFQVLFLILKYRPSVLHIASSASIGIIKDLCLTWLSILLNIPVVMHWRFGRIPALASMHNWEWKLLVHVIRKSTFSIVLDAKSYNTLRIAGFHNVVQIPNPISLDIEFKSRKHPEKNNIGPFDKVLFVGHVIRSKGVFELVNACMELPIIKELILIGPYEENVKEELINLVKPMTSGLKINFMGTIVKDEVLEQMFNAPVFVLPSYTEGFPNVIIEAMAMGCAIIATDVGAIPEILDVQSNNPCGICIPPQNIEKLKESILELMLDPVKTDKMGKRGIDRVLKNYTMGKITKEYISLWENAIVR